jgi:hypothetical protein
MFSGFIKRLREKKAKDAKEEECVKPNSNSIDNNEAIDEDKNNTRGVIDDKHDGVNYKKIVDKRKKSKIQTIVIEKDQEIDPVVYESIEEETIIIPSIIKEKIERIILKILYEEKSVKTLKILIEKVLERANSERIIISEKIINQIIYDLNEEEQIMFTQSEGWKIRI